MYCARVELDYSRSSADEYALKSCARDGTRKVKYTRALKTLISLFQVCLIRVEAKLCRAVVAGASSLCLCLWANVTGSGADPNQSKNSSVFGRFVSTCAVKLVKMFSFFAGVFYICMCFLKLQRIELILSVTNDTIRYCGMYKN